MKRLSSIHFRGWISLLLAASLCTAVQADPDTETERDDEEESESKARTRHYYIAAEDVVWDYAPSSQNLLHCMGEPAPCAIPEPWDNSHVFNKVRYIEYTDASFNVKKRQAPWLGVLGPVLRAEVGDTLLVHFCNRSKSDHPYSMHPHGVKYDKNSEGAEYRGLNGEPAGNGARVMPGACFTYVWKADESAGPAAGEVSSKVWWYHSHIDEAAETNAGLLGPLIITRKGMARRDGRPKDVDKEFVIAFFIFDELDGAEEGLMHAMNGYIYGNLPGLVSKNGDRVRWHVLGMGNELDLHTAHWHGENVSIGAPLIERRTDVVELLPGSMVTADMKMDNPGEWLFHCHVADHLHAGMMATYQILP